MKRQKKKKRRLPLPSDQSDEISVSFPQQDLRTIGDVDYVPPSFPPPSGIAQMLVLEDNDAVIKMTLKGRSPNMRHVARTHRVDLDWLFERFQTDPAILIIYVNTTV